MAGKLQITEKQVAGSSRVRRSRLLWAHAKPLKVCLASDPMMVQPAGQSNPLP